MNIFNVSVENLTKEMDILNVSVMNLTKEIDILNVSVMNLTKEMDILNVSVKNHEGYKEYSHFCKVGAIIHFNDFNNHV